MVNPQVAHAEEARDALPNYSWRVSGPSVLVVVGFACPTLKSGIQSGCNAASTRVYALANETDSPKQASTSACCVPGRPVVRNRRSPFCPVVNSGCRAR